jgi:hypothetical protein
MITIRISRHLTRNWYVIHFPSVLHEVLPKQLSYKVFPTHIHLGTPSTVDSEKVGRVTKDSGLENSRAKRLHFCSHYQEIEVGYYTLDLEDSDTLIINL